MKNFFLIIILFAFGLVSCKKSQEKKISISTKSDTILLKDKDVFFISPTDKNIVALKKKYGEDFYTIADDANNYFSIATEYLDSLKIQYKNIDDDKIIGFKTNNKFISIPKYKNYWSAIFYNSGKYKVIDLVNFEDEYISFFGNQNDNKGEGVLKNWYGLYLNSDSRELTSSKSIMDKIGWYKLSMTSNEISFESDERMESEFPTESPGGIYINYKCDYKIIGDTIRLYEKTANENSPPKEITKTDADPVLILYKKDNKYYGVSSYISSSENLNNAIRMKSKSPYLFIKFN